jgi:excisionase family DNA binding protein
METFLTPEELSKMLKVSRVWVYKLCDQGRIPFFRLAGKVIRFREEDIRGWLEGGRGVKYERDKN